MVGEQQKLMEQKERYHFNFYKYLEGLVIKLENVLKFYR